MDYYLLLRDGIFKSYKRLEEHVDVLQREAVQLRRAVIDPHSIINPLKNRVNFLEDKVKEFKDNFTEAKAWKKAYFELLYRRYCSLPTGYFFKEDQVEKFELWMFGQVSNCMDIQSMRTEIKTQKLYLEGLERDFNKVDAQVRRVRKKIEMKKKDLEDLKKATEKEEDAAAVVVHPKFATITGGRDGTTNWLNNLSVGAIFLARKRGDGEYLCYQFVLDWKGKRGALLSSNVPVKAEVPVDMLQFSLLHELVEVQREGYDTDN